MAAAASVIDVAGIDVVVEGEGAHALVLVHGWPDTYRLWDALVAHLLATCPGQFRCVRFTLAGFDTTRAPRPTSLQQMADLIGAIVDRVSPDAPVTLVLHDWGCVFGYEYLAQKPARVARLVAVDIGDHNSGAMFRALSAKAKWGVFAYQAWLAVAWFVGRGLSANLATRMTRSMARSLRCKTDPASIGWQMNYPYAMQWTGAYGGFRGAAQVAPACPTLYTYGQRKPFQFQSQRWLDRVAAQPGSAVQGFASGHWVMVDQKDAFNQCVSDWLTRTPVRA